MKTNQNLVTSSMLYRDGLSRSHEPNRFLGVLKKDGIMRRRDSLTQELPIVQQSAPPSAASRSEPPLIDDEIHGCAGQMVST